MQTTPYILAGLALTVGFRCGLFNIGAEGQFYIGALFAVTVGFAVKGLPVYIHLPLAVLAGALGGALWGAIPGYLKAKLGTHEVINTIMMNYIAVRLVDWLVTRRGRCGIPRLPTHAHRSLRPRPNCPSSSRPIACMPAY